MALVVEDGTGSNEAANTFADLAAIKSYLGARGIALPQDNDIVIMAIKAMDYIVSREEQLQGVRIALEQQLPYPRIGVVVFGFDLATDVVPTQAIAAQCQLVADQANGVDIMPNTTSAPIKREKTGPLETEYAVSAGDLASPVLAAAEALLKPLYRSGGFRLKTYRA